MKTIVLESYQILELGLVQPSEANWALEIVYICVCVPVWCVYPCVCVSACPCTCVCVPVCVCACPCACVYMCVYLCACVCVSACLCAWCMCLYVHVSVCDLEEEALELVDPLPKQEGMCQRSCVSPERLGSPFTLHGAFL